tara:strand:- start:325 stop:951 length:627 start_codon:yes stop_codon:yes gene_type:complete
MATNISEHYEGMKSKLSSASGFADVELHSGTVEAMQNAGFTRDSENFTWTAPENESGAMTNVIDEIKTYVASEFHGLSDSPEGLEGEELALYQQGLNSLKKSLVPTKLVKLFKENKEITQLSANIANVISQYISTKPYTNLDTENTSELIDEIQNVSEWIDSQEDEKAVIYGTANLKLIAEELKSRGVEFSEEETHNLESRIRMLNGV